MSRSEKRRRREQREQLRSMTVQHRTYAPRAETDLERAESLIGGRRYDEARRILEECDRATPRCGDVLHLLLEVYRAQEEFEPYCRTCERLLTLLPDNRELQFTLAGGYMCSGRPTRALAAFRRFLHRWPDDPLADRARQGVADLEPIVEKLHAQSPFAPEERSELAALHEDVLGSISAAEFERAIELAGQLLARAPTFLPAMNNLALACFECGRTDEAIALSRRVLEQEPQNFQALGNLARHLLLVGRRAEADQVAAELRAAHSEHEDVWSKKAETFSFLGDDRAVVEALTGARAAGHIKERSPQAAMLLHLAGVAHARLGDEKEARRCWRESMRSNPGLKLAAENLADVDKPVSERHGPWPYSMNYWVRLKTVEALQKALAQAVAETDDNEEGRSQAARRVVAEHPRVASAVPLLLDRGDEPGREFAVRLARLVATPELLQALREFCLSPRGPDALRIDVANFLYTKGVLPAGRIPMWINGKVQDLELLGFTITDEPEECGYSDEVLEWTYDAVQATGRGDGRTAERLLKKAIETVGDRPDLLNNLAMAYFLQGRDGEGHALARQVHERWPEYFFGVIYMANSATGSGDYERAEKLLKPLRGKQHYHRTEFTALCTAQVQLFIDTRKFDSARHWLEMWKQVDPEHRDIAGVERRLKIGSAIGRVVDFFGGRTRRDAPHDTTGPSQAAIAAVPPTRQTQRELFE
ncbi:MAG: tetratricopeptide repeat protein [Deltaproteobacteria bacterium]